MRILKGIESGAIYETNSSGKLEITRYINYFNVEVRFLDTGYEKTVQMGHIRYGKVKDPFYPSVCGVGFIGVGEFKVSIKSKHTKAYTTWNNMLERCYSKKLHKKYPTYIGCAVHPDWHNFQTFAKWYYENHPADGGDYHLDKDIKIEENKEYSPNACMFVSPADNTVKAKAKTYMFIDPDGGKVEIYNLNEFCRGKGLDPGTMYQVHLGNQNQHKGWRLA